MHGATITSEALPVYNRALHEQRFAYEGRLFGREIGPAGP